MRYILINGKKRSGKDFFAKMLSQELKKLGYSSEVMSFADPIKDIISTTLGISLEVLDEYKNKQAVLSIDGTECTNLRSVLQMFGTEAMKKYFGEHVWVNLLMSKANKSNDFIIVPDFRFLKEFIKNSITIKILNNHNFIDTHISENELNDFRTDYVLDNTNYRLKEHDAKELALKIIS